MKIVIFATYPERETFNQSWLPEPTLIDEDVHYVFGCQPFFVVDMELEDVLAKLHDAFGGQFVLGNESNNPDVKAAFGEKIDWSVEIYNGWRE